MHSARDARTNSQTMNTKVGAPTVSTRVLEKKGDSGSSHAQGFLEKQEAEQEQKGDSGSSHAQGFLEIQADQEQKLYMVKAPHSVKDEEWWTPDPMTGVFVPEHYHGHVTTAPRESIPKLQNLMQRASQLQTSSGAASHDKDLSHSRSPWFENMEELPDMERPRRK